MTETLSRRFTQEELLQELRKSLGKSRILTNVYLLWDDVIAKRGTYRPVTCNEYQIGNLLFVKGIQVPLMYDFIENVFNEESYLIMQRIQGKEIGTTFKGERKEAVRQLKSELGKVLEMGIYPFDSLNGGNSIFNRKEGKLYLIDFGFWIRNAPKEWITQFCEGLENYS
jgi:hypothetical protein